MSTGRVTFKALKKRASEINMERGVEDGTVGALQVYGDICGYAIDLIISTSHAVHRLYGIDTPKECMRYLNSCQYIGDIERYMEV